MIISAKKSLGQNFLHHKGTLHKIITAANLAPTDHVIEIGPGHGVLTKELIKKAKHVTAIELDNRLIPELQETFANTPNFKLLHQDALTFTPPDKPYKLVANIPYYITSPIINHFLREQPANRRPTYIVLLVQREVAQKICAQADNEGLNVLAIQVQLFGTPKIVSKVPASHFNPAPKVDSAILSIHVHVYPRRGVAPPEGEPFMNAKKSEKKLTTPAEIAHFFKLIHAGFAHKRKKLIRNLEKLTSKSAHDSPSKNFPNATPKKLQEAFNKLNLDQNTRAENLTIPEWKKLYSILS